jgi:hypothetical protein
MYDTARERERERERGKMRSGVLWMMREEI